MFGIRQCLSKKKPEKNEKWGLVSIQESYMYMCEKSSILVYTFLVSCDSRIEPISETAIFYLFFHVGTANTTYLLPL